MHLLTSAVQTFMMDAAYFHCRMWSLLQFTWLRYQRSIDGVNTLFLEHLYGLFCIFLSLSEAFESDFLSGFHSWL